MAARNSGMPALGVYLVKPACNASIAAALICSGVSKSGSPAPNPHTSMPSAFIAFALLSIESVREGVSWAARSEISMSILFVLIKGAATLLAAVKVFNQSFKIILFHTHNRHLALRVFNRIRRRRGVNHDCLTELFSDRARRCFRRIGGAEHVANFADGILALINERDAFFRPGRVPFFRKRIAWPRAGHEFDDVFPRVAAFAVSKFFLQHRQHGTIKLFSLRHAHPMDFETDNIETGPRKNFDHAAGPDVWKLKIVRLNQNQGLLDLCLLGKLYCLIEN